MDLDRIDGIARDVLAMRRDFPFREPGWMLYHGARTGRIAVRLAGLTESDVDRDALYVAGLFHDVAKEEKCHNEAGARRTRQLLAEHVPAATLAVICEGVRLHNQRKADGLSDFAKLIQDADSIDHVGLIDVWLSFYWSGFHGETIDDHAAWIDGDERRRYREYMRTHLHFDASRAMFDERLRLADRFFSDFRQEYLGDAQEPPLE